MGIIRLNSRIVIKEPGILFFVTLPVRLGTSIDQQAEAN
jgi:hypothetical protein